MSDERVPAGHPAPPVMRAACARARLMLAVASRAAVCDAAGLPADLASVDALARAQLAARSGGRPAVLAGVSDELLDLLRFTGLVEVLRVQAVVAPIRRPAGGPAPAGGLPAAPRGSDGGD